MLVIGGDSIPEHLLLGYEGLEQLLFNVASFNRVLCKAAGTHRDLHKTQLDQTLPKYQLWSQRGRDGKIKERETDQG